MGKDESKLKELIKLEIKQRQVRTWRGIISQEYAEEEWKVIYDKTDAFLEKLSIPYKSNRAKDKICCERHCQSHVCEVTIPVKGNKNRLQALKNHEAVVFMQIEIVDGQKYETYAILADYL